MNAEMRSKGGFETPAWTGRAERRKHELISIFNQAAGILKGRKRGPDQVDGYSDIIFNSVSCMAEVQLGRNKTPYWIIVNTTVPSYLQPEKTDHLEILLYPSNVSFPRFVMSELLPQRRFRFIKDNYESVRVMRTPRALSGGGPISLTKESIPMTQRERAQFQEALTKMQFADIKEDPVLAEALGLIF